MHFASGRVRRKNRTIGVNLAVFDSVLATMDINMLKKHPSKTPYREPRFLLENAAINILKKSAETPYQTPQANKPYGTKEKFEGSKVSAQSPVRLGNRTYRAWV